MNKKTFYELLKAVPKAEIHIHTEAVISRNTVKKLYKKCTGSTMTSDEVKQLFTYDDLNGFIQAFIKIQNFFTDPSDFELVFKDFAKYLQDNNVVYCEAFVAPTAFLKKGFDFHQIITTMAEGISRIKEEQKRSLKLLIDLSRSFGPENAQHNLDLTLAENNPVIIGVGLGGAEAKGPAKDYDKVFTNAKNAGLHTVLHAGEDVESWSIKDAINLCHAERIGHGITAAADEELIKSLAETKLPLEICPTSNTFTKKVVTRMEDHPIRKFYDEGVFVTVNTDDPTFFKASLIDEYWNLYSKLHFTLEEIKQVILNGFNASFISDEEKKDYCSKATEAWNQWFKEHPEVTE